jgi:hypothetical protein
MMLFVLDLKQESMIVHIYPMDNIIATQILSVSDYTVLEEDHNLEDNQFNQFSQYNLKQM